VLCLFALGRPDLEAHWESLQTEEAFKSVKEWLCSILTNTITAVSYSTPLWRSHNLKLQKAGLLLATSGVFVTTVSPVPYFDYTSPAPYFLLFVSLMMAMIAMLTSGLSMMRWLYADRQGTQEVRVIFALPTTSTDPCISKSSQAVISSCPISYRWPFLYSSLACP